MCLEHFRSNPSLGSKETVPRLQVSSVSPDPHPSPEAPPTPTPPHSSLHVWHSLWFTTVCHFLCFALYFCYITFVSPSQLCSPSPTKKHIILSSISLRHSLKISTLVSVVVIIVKGVKYRKLVFGFCMDLGKKKL